MSHFEIAPFFSLESFQHKKIFLHGAPVWNALLELNGYLDRFEDFRIEIEVPEGVVLERPEQISIGKGTVIEPGVLIQGPCIIGKNCVIRHGAYLRENVILGDGCVVGHSAELKHSILLNGAAATHFVYVGDSIVGSFANLGAGVKCANLRIDRKEVAVRFENEQVKSGLKKFGAVIGDRVQIGCNCVLNPGTLIGAESVCYPLLNVGGYIPPKCVVKGDRSFRIESMEDPKVILKQMGKGEANIRS
jgi:NDP-sugar pyrophosphorylase family protein